MQFFSQISIEVIKTLLSLCLLLLSWHGGQKILSAWELKKKRKETDLQTSQQIHILIGEWKAIWRTWKFIVTNKLELAVDEREKIRLELFDRASVAEGSVEAILLRIALEHALTEEEAFGLGLFRQTFQQLRQAIRENYALLWTRKSPEYWLFYDLALRASFITNRDDDSYSFTLIDRQRQLKRILAVDTLQWQKALAQSNFIPE